MFRAVKIRLLPTEEQEELMFKSVGTARYAYNWGLSRWQELYKEGPTRVAIEDLNIIGTMKNKHLSEKIQEQKLYEFTRQLEYKCKFNGIELVKADRWFPLSKMCSNCGNVKKNLKLKDRLYICQCGLEIDRDKNTSINLGNYKVS
ncbi:MAG TPA: zinc ribbon domain-containing protein [Clostridia bacterium]|nr:zinc ribbon domain-containing protein [Clostridia bacterium]